MEKIDKNNMYGSIWDFPENIVEAIGLSKSINLKNTYLDINKIIVAGMGGSAIGGDVVSSLVGDEIKIPYFVIRGYNIPAWVDSKTLVICSSYSGNTEETIEIFEKSKSVKAKTCVITTGGKLEKLCDSYNLDRVIIPSGLQPRAALAFSFIPIYIIKSFFLSLSRHIKAVRELFLMPVIKQSLNKNSVLKP